MLKPPLPPSPHRLIMTRTCPASNISPLHPCRFSSDTSVVDDSLPFILNILLANAVSLMGLLAVLLYSQPLLGLVLLPLAVVYRCEGTLGQRGRGGAGKLSCCGVVGTSALTSVVLLPLAVVQR